MKEFLEGCAECFGGFLGLCLIPICIWLAAYFIVYVLPIFIVIGGVYKVYKLFSV